MSAWTDALTDERKCKAKGLYSKLKAIGWSELGPKDQAIMQILGWFCLEEDDAGEPEQYIDADLEEAETDDPQPA